MTKENERDRERERTRERVRGRERQGGGRLMDSPNLYIILLSHPVPSRHGVHWVGVGGGGRRMHGK